MRCSCGLSRFSLLRSDSLEWGKLYRPAHFLRSKKSRIRWIQPVEPGEKRRNYCAIYVQCGGNVIGEVNPQNQVTNYIRGASGLILSKDPSNVMRYYVTNGHGDVMGLTDTTGTVIKSYTYDAFGIEQNIDSNDTNPFRYCGEYFDSETQSIYLRARYYSPAIGRFTQQDPAMDGLNWYVYCSSNPVNSIDPIGLFDYNSRLSKSREYSEDVEVLQNELVWLGYLDMSNGGWGYFGNKTLDAVNAYKNSMGLGNNGENWGVVGLETWQSLGLQYRTQADIDAGVKMIMYGGRTQYKDISVALSTAVLNDRKTFQDNEGNLGWFKGMVGDSGEWNIKRSPDAWENKVKTTFPGYSTKMYFNGNLVTVEDVGNITYGYLGTAAGIAPPILVGASSANHIKNHGVFGWGNEISDHDYIQMGIDWYNGVFA